MNARQKKKHIKFQIMSMQPGDIILISNFPDDPCLVNSTVERIRRIVPEDCYYMISTGDVAITKTNKEIVKQLYNEIVLEERVDDVR